MAFSITPEEVKRRSDLVRSIGEEVVQPEELDILFSKVEHPRAYDGFEPSGRMHVAQGVLKMINVNKLTRAGCHFVFWVADWFAFLNNKMGGDLDKIRAVGQYMIEVWKAVGMDMTNVEFVWASEEINKRSDEYWTLVFDVATRNQLPRITRCAQIMGRKENNLTAAQIFYPCMQCADVFFLKAHICQLGMDQRKVNMLAREYAVETKRKPPVVVSHHMLMGLEEGQEKMSKSKPDSAIFMEDTEQDVNRKIKRAYCPPGIVEANPIMDYAKNLIFPWMFEKKLESLDITRSVENGGDVKYTNYEDLEKDFVAGKLHPGDLKPAIAKVMNMMLQPVRDHFKNNKEAAALLKRIKGWVDQMQKQKEAEAKAEEETKKTESPAEPTTQ